MEIIEIRNGKKDYLDLLLLADEQENMIDRYLERGTMYGLAAEEGETVGDGEFAVKIGPEGGNEPVMKGEAAKESGLAMKGEAAKESGLAMKGEAAKESGLAMKSEAVKESGLVKKCGKKIRAVCVVTDEGGGVLELKNIAVNLKNQRSGYGRALVEFVERRYAGEFRILQVGTGDSPLTIPFYENLGFVKSHRIENFFVDFYESPIFECGKQLIDMIYLRKDIGRGPAAKKENEFT